MEATIKVAIADDHQLVLNGVKEIILSFGGFSVDFTANNGKELFDKLQAAVTLPDVVVMDISMPEWDGYQAMEAIRKEWPQLKVLILTMHKHEQAILRMIRGGANGYLLKNSPPKILELALRTIHEKGRYYSEVVASSMHDRMLKSTTVPFLTDKEIQLLKYTPTDMTYKAIADEMGISESSVAGYRMTLFEKLEVNSRAGLAVCAINMGLFALD